jgi:hypothetical protein
MSEYFKYSGLSTRDSGLSTLFQASSVAMLFREALSPLGYWR